MKTLTLIRHAKSSWKHPDTRDIDRPLNKRGKQDAPLMGVRLGMRKLRPDLIVTSPARRAMSTAVAIAEAVDYPVADIHTDERIYDAWVDDLWSVIREVPDAHQRIYLIGHNPGFNLLAESITGEDVSHFPTCGVVHLELELDAWKAVGENTARLVFFDYPKSRVAPS
jgi:phosphohistidine phosphatase